MSVLPGMYIPELWIWKSGGIEYEGSLWEND